MTKARPKRAKPSEKDSRNYIELAAEGAWREQWRTLDELTARHAYLAGFADGAMYAFRNAAHRPNAYPEFAKYVTGLEAVTGS